MRVLFSDLDGTLVHYPKDFSEYAAVVAEDTTTNTATIEYKQLGHRRDCRVLTSLTGGKGYISLRTLELVAKLRELGVIFVIITGARTSTYAQRRPLLPEADYEFFENGGRMLVRGELDPAWTDAFAAQVGPVADRVALLPAGLPAPRERQGALWALCRELRADGWHVDARDYTTNFRVDVGKSAGKTVEDFRAAVDGRLAGLGLATSFNLGKADVYPAGSGKANAAAHVLALEGVAASEAVAMFDDDNDLELGALVGRSFLPGVTHESVLAAMKKHGDRWVLTKSQGILGAEEALECIIALREAAASPFASVALLSGEYQRSVPGRR